MTLAWVESEIEKTQQAGNTAKAVYDLAALLIVRDFLRSATSPNTKAVQEKHHRDAVTLTAYSADLHKVPTIEQVEAALGAVVITTPEEKQRALDARTWAGIIKSKN